MIDIRTFNAEQAWKLTQLSMRDRLEEVLNKVEKQARIGGTEALFTSTKFDSALIRELENKGFKISYTTKSEPEFTYWFTIGW